MAAALSSNPRWCLGHERLFLDFHEIGVNPIPISDGTPMDLLDDYAGFWCNDGRLLHQSLSILRDVLPDQALTHTGRRFAGWDAMGELHDDTTLPVNLEDMQVHELCAYARDSLEQAYPLYDLTHDVWHFDHEAL